MTNTAPIIRTEQEHQEARAEYSAALHQITLARATNQHERAARIAREIIPLEDALEAYEKVDPIRTDEDYAAAHNAYTTLQEHGRTDGDYPRRIAALLRQYEHALTTYDAMNGRR